MLRKLNWDIETPEQLKYSVSIELLETSWLWLSPDNRQVPSLQWCVIHIQSGKTPWRNWFLSTSAVYLNGNIGDWVRTTVGVRQGCLLSPSLFNIFLEWIDWPTRRSPRNSQYRRHNNYQFTFHWWHWWPGRKRGRTTLVDRLDKTFAAIGMEISAEKTNLMTNSANGISIDIRVNGEKLDEVDSFKYLGAVVTDQGSKPEVLSRTAQTTAALARLKTIWNDKHISLSSKIRLMRLVLLCACETWTLTVDILKKLRATEMRCLVSHTEITSLTTQSETQTGKPLGPMIIS